MSINKSIGILIIIILLLIAQYSFADDIIYKGSYRIIQWPVLIVEYSNNASSIGIIIVISPANNTAMSNSLPFMGLEVINSNYYLVNGLLYGNQTIIVIAIEPLNMTSMPHVNTANNTINTVNEENLERVIIRGRPSIVRTITVGPTPNSSSHVINSINTTATPTIISQINSSNEKSITNNTSGYLVLNFRSITVITASSLIVLIILAPLTLLINRENNDKNCIENEFTKLIRQIGLRDPSATPREVGELIMKNLSKEVVNDVVSKYEEAIYGNKPIKCMEFKQLIRSVRRELKHVRRNRRGW